jgi:hypothetical protein
MISRARAPAHASEVRPTAECHERDSGSWRTLIWEKLLHPYGVFLATVGIENE